MCFSCVFLKKISCVYSWRGHIMLFSCTKYKQANGFLLQAFGMVQPMSSELLLLLEHLPHAGSSCFMAILWLHPFMTFDRLILATVFTTYLCCGLSVTGADYSYVQKCSMRSTKMVRSVSYKQQKTR